MQSVGYCRRGQDLELICCLLSFLLLIGLQHEHLTLNQTNGPINPAWSTLTGSGLQGLSSFTSPSTFLEMTGIETGNLCVQSVCLTTKQWTCICHLAKFNVNILPSL